MNHEGGVVAFYNILLKRFGNKEFVLRHHPLGSRMVHFHSPFLKRLLYPFFYAYDVLSLLYLLLRNPCIRIVQVNPSLIPIPLIRDGFIILLAGLMGRKVVVFFHGWKEYTLSFLKRHSLMLWIFKSVYQSASVAVVLSTRFKDDLVALGFHLPSIEVTTTMYEAEAVLPAAERSGERVRFLYLGRISYLKGINEIIEAAKILAQRGYDFEFVMVGHGDREGVVEEYSRRVKEYGIENRFCFTGPLTGSHKFEAFADSDVYVFPSWTEGCPTSVLEALGSGLFVISTDVGALRDVIADGINGRIVRCKDPEDLANALAWACEQIEKIRTMREGIKAETLIRYEAQVVAGQFNNIYHKVING